MLILLIIRYTNFTIVIVLLENRNIFGFVYINSQNICTTNTYKATR